MPRGRQRYNLIEIGSYQGGISTHDLVHKIDGRKSRGRRYEPFGDSSSMPPVVMWEGQAVCDRMG
jgi:hypothetical protein